jgi:transposase InsO family protein
VLPQSIEPDQYTAISFTEALIDAGIAPSIGTVGDALDNALMESTIGLYKTEFIEHDRSRSWTGRAEVEREAAAWVHWYNTTRIHHSIGKQAPIEYEDQYRQINPHPARRGCLIPASIKSRAVRIRRRRWTSCFV